MKQTNQMLEVILYLVATFLGLSLLIGLSGCKAVSEGDVPCVLLKCSDYTSENDAWNNGVINELCGYKCKA